MILYKGDGDGRIEHMVVDGGKPGRVEQANEIEQAVNRVYCTKRRENQAILS
jgi:hypothetical protein